MTLDEANEKIHLVTTLYLRRRLRPEGDAFKIIDEDDPSLIESVEKYNTSMTSIFDQLTFEDQITIAATRPEAIFKSLLSDEQLISIELLK